MPSRNVMTSRSGSSDSIESTAITCHTPTGRPSAAANLRPAAMPTATCPMLAMPHTTARRPGASRSEVSELLLQIEEVEELVELAGLRDVEAAELLVHQPRLLQPVERLAHV